jgi:Cu/Ag efflux pump CusA
VSPGRGFDELEQESRQGRSRGRSGILANVPFATNGGILALAISRQYLSVPSAIGFIAVFGVRLIEGICRSVVI